MAMEKTTSTNTPQKHFKNTKYSHHHHQNQNQNHDHDDSTALLLPGLPNHLAHLCLSPLPPPLLSAVCRSWRRLLYSPSFPHFFSLYALLSPTNHHHHHHQQQQHASSVGLFSLDPISSEWRRVPGPPSPLRLLHRHPSFIFRTIPVQSVAVSGRLVLIAATDHQFLPGLCRPLVFDPLSKSKHWSHGPPLPNPRRWCAAGSLGSTVYVASGIGSHYQSHVARSMEKWDMTKNEREWKWEKLAELKDSRFSREAIEAIEYRGKLFMVNVKGKAVKQGSVYDVVANRWEDMPEGMLAGWSGPVAATTVVGREEMYVVDEEKGGVRKYNPDRDKWEEVVESSEQLKGAEQVVAGRGRLCVVCDGGRRIVVVDVVGRPPRTWVVDPPPDMEVVGVHILPRMSLPE